MFNAADYRRIYDRFLGPLAQDVSLLVNNGTGFDRYDGVMAHVSNWSESDLVPEGSIRLGDLRIIILGTDIPPGIGRLSQGDRVEIDGRAYGVINWDENTRSVGAELIAVEATIRG
tara:strand:+ start:640 stop:987 length:348 start_codon:yes stop_codon:yes gene_type:complete